MIDEMSKIPEPQLPHLQKQEMAKGRDDLDYCIRMINEDQPVQHSSVYFYDRLLENGLKITAGEMVATDNVSEYNLKLDKLFALATAAYSFSPTNPQNKIKPLSDGN